MPQRIQTGNADGVGATPLNIEMKPKKNSLRGDRSAAARVRECRRADRVPSRPGGPRRLRTDVRRGLYTLNCF